jgi:hypothetical protein
MLTIPASSPPRSTSMWRTRWCVIRFITRLTLSSGDGGRTVLHDFLHSHRPGCLAIARECMNDFTFGNETKNRVPTRHYESANILCAEPVRCSLDGGFRSDCCDIGALTLQNAFESLGNSIMVRSMNQPDEMKWIRTSSAINLCGASSRTTSDTVSLCTPAARTTSGMPVECAIRTAFLPTRSVISAIARPSVRPRNPGD